MTYTSVSEDVREALGVASANDALILKGVKRAGRYLLRNFNFPDSLVFYETDALAAGSQEIDLEFGTGKVLGVRLKYVEGSDDPLYKNLARREHAVLPYQGGPAAFWRTEQSLKLDSQLDPDGVDSGDYTLEIWYQTVDLGVAETWLTCNYEDAMFHLSAMYCAPLVHKPELLQTYAALWQHSEGMLAVYLNELEWEHYDLRMGNSEPVLLPERYPASV